MSGTFLNPDGENSFIEICRKSSFVDKTNFIGEMIERLDGGEEKLVAFTRPRRFGKTITAQMLASFFSKGMASKNVFSKLKIATEYESKKYKNFNYENFLNKYDVVYVDMNDVYDSYKTYTQRSEKIQDVLDIVDYFEYSVIKELRERSDFLPILEKERVGNIGLSDALSFIHKKMDMRFIFIMDEWDLIYRDFRDDELLQKKYIDKLRGLFKASKGIECFSLVYLTGILPIKKYNSESALNNFKEYNMLKPGTYEDYLGFTEAEVEKIVSESNCSLSLKDIKDWYDGYKLNGKEIYNPNSVISAIFDGKCQSYWSGTSSNNEVVRLINMNFDGIKNDILNLIAGAKIMFDYETFQNDMVSIENKDQLFSLLVCLGYLGCEEKGNGSTCRLAFVPNREIRSALSSIVRKQSWYNSLPIIERSEKLFHAIKNCDAGTVSQIIGDIHNSTYISVLGYNREEALVFCLIAGLMWSTGSDYECYREVQSGIGFVDLVYVPLSNVDLPIMLIEFKRDAGADVAIKQIKDNNYVSRYCNNKPDHEIIMIGLSYNSKNKEHDCVIESLTH